MGKGGYGVAEVRWICLKTEKNKIYGVENRTKSMKYIRTVKRKGVPKGAFRIDRLSILVPERI